MGDLCVVLYGGQLMQKLQMLKDLVRNWDDYIMVLSKKKGYIYPKLVAILMGKKLLRISPGYSKIQAETCEQVHLQSGSSSVATADRITSFCSIPGGSINGETQE